MTAGGRAGAAQIVPPSGASAGLVMLASAAMAFLAALALALAGTATRTAAGWQGELSDIATLYLPAADTDRPGEIARALALLDTTPGVRKARVIGDLEQRALLRPWLGEGLDPDAVSLPTMIEITSAPNGFDPQNLRLRLAGEFPEATLDDHGRWQVPLARASSRLRWSASAAAALTLATLATVTALAARAALSAHAREIAVLRQVGAQDRWIARAFVRRITFRATAGALLGALAAAAALAAFPAAGDGLPGLRPQGWLWGVPALIPPAAALAAFCTAHLSARAILKGLP